MPITRAQIEAKLKTHVFTICLAALSKEKGSLTLVIDLLYEAAEKIVREAERGRG